jgi:hypothetical protein
VAAGAKGGGYPVANPPLIATAAGTPRGSRPGPFDSPSSRRTTGPALLKWRFDKGGRSGDSCRLTRRTGPERTRVTNPAAVRQPSGHGETSTSASGVPVAKPGVIGLADGEPARSVGQGCRDANRLGPPTRRSTDPQVPPPSR